MATKSITLEVSSAQQERALRHIHAWLQELNELADTAPDGQVLAVLEDAVVSRGRETLRVALEDAVQRRVDAAEEKKGRCGRASAVEAARTAGGRHGHS